MKKKKHKPASSNHKPRRHYKGGSFRVWGGGRFFAKGFAVLADANEAAGPSTFSSDEHITPKPPPASRRESVPAAAAAAVVVVTGIPIQAARR